MLSYAALCRRSGAKSLGQTLIVLNLAKASHSREIAALRDFDPADVRFWSEAAEMSGTIRAAHVRIAPKADIRLGSLPPPALRECRHCGLTSRSIAACRGPRDDRRLLSTSTTPRPATHWP